MRYGNDEKWIEAPSPDEWMQEHYDLYATVSYEYRQQHLDDNFLSAQVAGALALIASGVVTCQHPEINEDGTLADVVHAKTIGALRKAIITPLEMTHSDPFA